MDQNKILDYGKLKQNTDLCTLIENSNISVVIFLKAVICFLSD